jgi:uncharacterized membrane protein
VPELKIVFGVGTVDAIGEKTCLQAKAAFFPSEMLFFHGCFLSRKRVRGAADASVLSDLARLRSVICVVFDGEALAWHVGASDSSPIVADHAVPMQTCAVRIRFAKLLVAPFIQKAGKYGNRMAHRADARAVGVQQRGVSRMPICISQCGIAFVFDKGSHLNMRYSFSH